MAAGVKQASAYGPSCMQDPSFARIFNTPAGISERIPPVPSVSMDPAKAPVVYCR